MNRRLLVVLAFAFVMCRKETTVTNESPQQATTTAAATSTAAAPAVDLAGKTVDEVIPLKPNVVSQCRVGTKLDANGVVAESAKLLKAGEPVYVSMWLTESPSGLAVAVRTLDENREKELARVQKPANGAKTVTLEVEKLKAGKYHLESLWGGNAVCDDEIDVR